MLKKGFIFVQFEKVLAISHKRILLQEFLATGAHPWKVLLTPLCL